MKTFSKPVEISGVGVHSGKPAKMRILPYDKPGIYFVRTDLNSGLIPALYDNVSETKLRNTTIGNAPNIVKTIEHIMCALYVYGIDSAKIEIDGPETPIVDGSAAKFINEFDKAEIVEVAGKSKKIIIKNKVTVTQKDLNAKLPVFLRIKLGLLNLIFGKKPDGFVSIAPGKDGLQANATLVYSDKIIGRQSAEFFMDDKKSSKDRFVTEIARARTFGKFSEWEWLKKHGMGHGCDATNVIALNDAGDDVVNPEPYKLYWANEFVRHKLIDVFGDMYTSGGRIIGKLESYKGSHALNNLLLRKLFSDPKNYDIIES